MDIIEIGKIVNTHGIRGEIKLNPWTDDIEKLLKQRKFYYKKGSEIHSLKATQVRLHKNCAIIKLHGVDDLNKAESYRGLVFYVEKEKNLPEDYFYIADLIGLKVLTDQGELGKITEVFQTGANDVYEVKTAQGKNVLLPAIKQVVNEVNIQEGYMKVTLLDGLLED